MGRTDRSYKDLKQKQKSAIADKTYSMYIRFYLEIIECQMFPKRAVFAENYMQQYRHLLIKQSMKNFVAL